MNSDKINSLIQEICALEPALKGKEKDLFVLIEKLLKNKPEIYLDKEFEVNLKNELLKQARELYAKENFTNNNIPQDIRERGFNLNYMKPIYLGIGTLAVVVVVAIIATPYIMPKYSEINKSAKITFESGVREIAPNAFGALPSFTGGDGTVSLESAVKGLGGGGGGGGTMALDSVDAKMIMPPYERVVYKYKYIGDPLELSKESLEVYKKIRGGISENISGLLNSMDLGAIDLSTFSNTKLQNLTLTEDKELGLSINVNFQDGQVYISENYLKWRDLEREKCQDEACFNRYRLSINDIPEDSQVIAISDSFLREKRIDTSKYGAGVLEDNWRLGYERATDKSNYYIPEVLTVIYPELINGQAVRDMSGNPYGLRVSVSLTKMKVNGMYSLSSDTYESSLYDIETDPSRIIEVAENGGNEPIYYIQEENAQTKQVEVELGTPEFGYVNTWSYENNESSELFIPALIFPITKMPEVDYFWRQNVVVPLPKDMVAKLLENNGNGLVPTPKPLIEPMMMDATETPAVDTIESDLK